MGICESEEKSIPNLYNTQKSEPNMKSEVKKSTFKNIENKYNYSINNQTNYNMNNNINYSMNNNMNNNLNKSKINNMNNKMNNKMNFNMNNYSNNEQKNDNKNLISSPNVEKNISPQAIMKESTFYTIDPYIAKVSKAMCKIETNKKISSGFLIKLFKGKKDFFCLMTNEHTITKEMIAKRSSFNFYYDSSDSQSKTIDLNPQERYIKYFTNINIDVSIIEILPKDNIPKYYFLSANIVYMYNFDKLINQEIAVLQYPKGNLSYSYGIITAKTNTYEFSHSASTEEGSSGAPIFLKNSDKVIGIHTGSNLAKTINYGNFIGPIFDYLRKKSHQKKNLIINPQNNNNNINYKMNNLNYPCNLNKINALNNQNLFSLNRFNTIFPSYNNINLMQNGFSINKTRIHNIVFDFENEKRQKRLLTINSNCTIYQLIKMYINIMGLSEYNFEKYYLFLDRLSSKINPFSNEFVGQRFNEFDKVLDLSDISISANRYIMILRLRSLVMYISYLPGTSHTINVVCLATVAELTVWIYSNRVSPLIDLLSLALLNFLINLSVIL